MTGCIIGAGILAIPYVVMKAGFWTGIAVILVIGIVALIIHLLEGEIGLRSKKCGQLVTYADQYLGKKGKYLMFVAMMIGVYGSLVAYTLGVAQSLTSIFGGWFMLWAVIFYGMMAILVFGNLKVLEESELCMEIVKLVVFVLILAALFNSHHFTSARFTGFDVTNVFIPYGVLLFACLGTAAVPEVRQELKRCARLTKKVIIWGSVIPVIVYLLFTIAVVGVSGELTSEVATISIAQLVGGAGFILLHVFAILAMASSFVALAYALKDVFKTDFKMTNIKAWVITMLVPAIILLLGVESFVKTLDITGTFAGGLVGIIIILIHSYSKKFGDRKPEYVINIPHWGYAILISMFVAGMIYELMRFIS